MTILIQGVVANSTVDLDGQVMDKNWLSHAMLRWDWKNTVVTRSYRHSGEAVGWITGVEYRPLDASWVATVMLNDGNTERLLETSTMGFGLVIQNPLVCRDPKAKGGRIKAGEIIHLMLVDEGFLYGPVTILPARPELSFSEDTLTREDEGL